MSDDEHEIPPPPGLSVQGFMANGARFALVSFTLPVEQGEGARELTSTEVELLRALLRGASNAEIAAMRQKSVKTVSNQVSALLSKCGAASRAELAARWLELLSLADRSPRGRQ
jgi:DNA-binding NarL/FixJ family response regulator